MSTWTSFTKFATSVADTMAKAATTIEESARKAAADLETQHRITVEAKREMGDVEETNIVKLDTKAVLAKMSIPIPAGVQDGLSRMGMKGRQQAGDADGDDTSPIVALPPAHAPANQTQSLPWESAENGVDADNLRTQILALSGDKRNFLVSPPDGTDFVFDMPKYLPTALAILQIDKQLEQMRFELVPKQIKDDRFWQNYFYRVTRLQQSSMLLNQQPSSVVNASESLASANLPVEASNTSVKTPLERVSSSSSSVAKSNSVESFSVAETGPSVSAGLSSSGIDIPDSLEDAALGDEEYASTESFGADWEKELQNELDEV
ncbi:hypothetical protein CcCBS67573_g09507 [Chytriomyces confervae]|uniref:BSD domain-containing protein n=1 Tax=Chytriomyces confervae TaxID=246404 RepID=A0A507DV18_9FUNG|nr:hypothetical protein CcCBS67573_g09507 [Chytriomyces confervae]